jgi:hypothetical protein
MAVDVMVILNWCRENCSCFKQLQGLKLLSGRNLGNMGTAGGTVRLNTVDTPNPTISEAIGADRLLSDNESPR